MLLFLHTYYERIKKRLREFKQIAKCFVDALPDAKTFRSKLLRSQTIEDASLIIHEYFAEPHKAEALSD